MRDYLAGYRAAASGSAVTIQLLREEINIVWDERNKYNTSHQELEAQLAESAATIRELRDLHELAKLACKAAKEELTAISQERATLTALIDEIKVGLNKISLCGGPDAGVGYTMQQNARELLAKLKADK